MTRTIRRGTVRNVTLQQLRYLIAVVEHGSMTAAAQALFVVQPALSRSLQSLERELKVELFVRSGRGLVLTPEGVRVASLARQVLAGVRAIEDSVGTDEADTGRGTLRLATTQTLAIDFMSSLLPGFRAKRPEIDVAVDCRPSRDALFGALRKGEADLILTDLPVPADFRVHPLRRHEVVLVSPPDTPLPDPVPWRALDGLPMIVPPADSPRGRDFAMLFDFHGIRPRTAMETGDRGAWLACVAAGVGSALWYADLAQRFTGTIGVRSFSPPLTRTMGLAWLRRPMTPQIRALCAYARMHGVRELDYA